MKKPDLVYTTFIRTTPEKLWAAITTPEFTRQYWGNNANVSEWKKGASWEHIGEDGTIYHTGIVEEILPMQRLVLSWHNPSETEDISRVTFQLTQIDDTMKLDVIHGDFIDGSAMADRVSQGWPLVIASMKSYLETGQALGIWGKSACAHNKNQAA